MLISLAVLTAGQKTLSLRRSPEATDIVETHKDTPFTTQFSSQDGTSVRLSNDFVSYTFASAAQGFGLLSMMEPSSRIEHIRSSDVSPFLWNAEWRDADGLGYQTTNLYVILGPTLDSRCSDLPPSRAHRRNKTKKEKF